MSGKLPREKMVRAEEAVKIYELLAANNIPVWLTGGWGIDALLGEQKRLHKDLDVLILLDDVVRVCELLRHEGFELYELWSENRWVVDSYGNKTATAFVLQDPAGRQFDAHAMHIDKHGNGIPAWVEAEEFIFTKQDLSGVGTIEGIRVQCITPESQIACHKGYELPEAQKRDLALLQEKFGLG